MRRYSHRTARQVESVLAKITLCRTQALGGRLYRCPSCQHQLPVYNSCMDRHCPQCSGSRRVQWVEKTVKLIIKDVNYFHVIFTLPDKINSLALGNRKEVYSLLMQACWQALDDVLRQEQGIQPAAKTVLHTWNQELGVHLHVHALVPGGGPSVDGKRWIETKHPTHKRRKKLYLCDNRTLSQRFRKKFIDGMRRLHRKGLLKFEYQWQGESTTFEPWLKKLGDLDWNVYIEPPPKKTSSADQVVKYLARYMTGGPISDSRLISHEEGQITFWARSRDKNNKSRPFTLSGVRFVRAWCDHILPKQFTKSRAYGGFHSTKSEAYLKLCHELRGTKADEPEPTSQAERPVEEATEYAPKCPRCSAAMITSDETQRRSWRDVFGGPDRPDWYRAFDCCHPGPAHWHRER